MRLAIVSDIHYASPAEAARGPTMLDPVSPLRRALLLQYRRWIWMHDQFAHNHQLDRFLDQAAGADLVVANGDYACDVAYVGVSDEAAFTSATTCLGKLRRAFRDRFLGIIGDHELGKKMMAANEGGLRLASFERATGPLGLAPVWRHDVGRYVLLGVTSTLLAFPIYEAEALPEELPAWRERVAAHWADLRRHLAAIPPDRRLLLFCHDPSALPFLARDEAMRARLTQVERTIIGHLHSPFILRAARCLAGMPPLGFLGHTPRRLSRALREARHWRPFRLLLCPSTAGLQLFKDGGWLSLDLDPDARQPLEVRFHPLPWGHRPATQ